MNVFTEIEKHDAFYYSLYYIPVFSLVKSLQIIMHILTRLVSVKVKF